MKKNILFDLDGTLTDSGEGIINCATLALEQFGLPVPDRTTMREFVGPPLNQTFIKYGIPPEKTDEAIQIFRSRYNTVGVYENLLYPGIQPMLAKLREQGHRLYVATSKPEHMALLVLEHFGILPYFDMVCGATLDDSRLHKADVIAFLLNQICDQSDIVMIGDTEFDVLGAAAHRIPTIGVAWGYGSVQAMEQAGAMAIADTPESLLTLLQM